MFSCSLTAIPTISIGSLFCFSTFWSLRQLTLPPQRPGVELVLTSMLPDSSTRHVWKVVMYLFLSIAVSGCSEDHWIRMPLSWKSFSAAFQSRSQSFWYALEFRCHCSSVHLCRKISLCRFRWRFVTITSLRFGNFSQNYILLSPNPILPVKSSGATSATILTQLNKQWPSCRQCSCDIW